MKLFLLAFVATFVAAHAFDKRIVNGWPAAEGAHPHQATLQRQVVGGWYHFCGGSLISRNKVLTAAHCLDGLSASSLRVGLGWHQLTVSNPSRQTIRVQSFVLHPQYNPNAGGYPNDIAIITLSEDAVLNDAVNLAELAPYGASFSNQQCVISGWGQKSGSGSPADTLKEVNITKITNSQCASMWSRVYGANILDTHICVYEYPKSSCSGDSGGPMICGDYLAGVTSWGISTCDGTFPSVYVRTSEFRNWILYNL